MLNAASRDEPGCAVKANELVKTFAGVTALDGVSIELVPGEAVGLLGPNGSGKTTLVNCLSGVLKPNSGSIALFDEDMGRWSRERRAVAGMIRTYQNVRLFADLTAAENVEAGLVGQRDVSRASRRQRVIEALEAHDLAIVARRRVSELSYGQQKRVEVARALVVRPRVLLLDEPAAGLGREEAEKLGRVLDDAKSRLGCSVLLIDHNVELVMRVSDRIVVLADGKVLRSGAPDAIARDPEVLRVYLGGSEEE